MLFNTRSQNTPFLVQFTQVLGLRGILSQLVRFQFSLCRVTIALASMAQSL